VMSFENITTSRAEEEHVKLKKALKISKKDLKRGVNVIELILKNERAKYLIAEKEVKTRFSRNCNVTALSNIHEVINFYALRLICKQLTKSISEYFSVCIKAFKISMRLFCAQVIKRLHDNDDVLRLKDVHFH
jgi:hypothetical protein